MADIDDLQIKISAEAQSAASAIQTLVSQLQALQGSTSGLKEASNALSNMSKALNNASSSSGTDRAANSAKKLAKNLNLGNLTAEQFRERLSRLTIPEIKSDSLKDLQRQLEKTKEKLEYLRNKMANTRTMGGEDVTSGSSYRGMQVNEQMLQMQADSLEEKIAQIGSGDFNLSDLTGYASKVSIAFAAVVKTIQAAINIAKSFGAAVKKAFDTIVSVAKTVVNTVQKIGSALGSVVSKVTGFGQKSDFSFKKALMTVLRYGFGIRGLFVLFNRLRSAAKEGLDNLVQYSDKANQSVSALMSSLQYLKNSLAAAFYPIMNVVVPYLTAFIDTIAQALNYVGQFFAALTGKSYTVQATKANYNYAKSLDKTSKSAKQAKQNLLGIDELNIISDDDSSGSGDDTNGGAATVKDMFKESEIADWIKNLADMFKKAWKNGDFTEIGHLIGEKLRDALNSIDWGIIQEFAQRFARSLATFINGFVETEGLADSIGHTIAQALNTGIGAVNTFLTTTHWTNVGKFIADGLNTVLSQTDFYGLGETVANKINAIFLTLNGWSSNFHFANVGYAIRNAINGACDNINWQQGFTAAENIGKGIAEALNNVITPDTFGKLGETVANGLNVIITAVKNFIAKADFKQYGRSLAAAFQKFVDTINWKDVGESIGKGLKGITDAILEFINDTDWDDVWSNLKVMFQEIGKNFSIDDFSNFASQILGFICDAVKKINWEHLALNICVAIANINWGQAIETLFNVGIQLLLGIMEGFIYAVSQIPRYIAEFFKAIWDDICSAFGIHSPAKEMKPLGENILLGIVEGFKSKFENFKKSIDDFFDIVKEKLSTTKWKEKIGSIKEAFDSKWSEVKTWWSGTAVVKWWESVKSNFTADQWKARLGSIKDALKSKWDDAKSWWDYSKQALKEYTPTIGSIKQKLSDAWNTAKSWWDNTKQAMSTYTPSIGDIKAKVSSAWETAKSWWNNSKGAMNSYTPSIGSIKDAIANAWNEAKNWWNNKSGLSKYTIGFHVTYDTNVSSTKKAIYKALGLSGWPSLSFYQTGGFLPTSFSMVGVGENGVPEILGQVGGRPAVAGNAEITGIADAVYSTGNAESMLLNTAVSLLQQIADKNVSVNIGDKDIYRASVRGQRQTGVLLRTSS